MGLQDDMGIDAMDGDNQEAQSAADLEISWAYRSKHIQVSESRAPGKRSAARPSETRLLLSLGQGQKELPT